MFLSLVLPVEPALAGTRERGPCAKHGGVDSVTAQPDGDVIKVTFHCNDGMSRGPYVYRVRGPYPCADHGGVHSATARPGAGVVEIIIYCNDGSSEGPYVYRMPG